MPKTKPYRRVVIKLSGELFGKQGQGISGPRVAAVARELQQARKLGVEIGLVIGAGNLVRGKDLASRDFRLVSAHSLGIVATVLNSMALHEALQNLKVPSAVLSAIPVGRFVESFSVSNADRLLSSKQIVLFAAGTGDQFFTTDTAAALRAVQMGADIMLKATQVDGIYSSDPQRHRSAKKFDHLTYDEAISRRLGVMDMTAFALCRDNRLPIGVFRYRVGALHALLAGKRQPGTIVTA